MRNSIFAFTSSGADYPEYLSVNINDGRIEVTVRGPKKPATEQRPHGQCGDTVCMILPPDQAKELYRSLLRHLTPTTAA